MHRGRRFTPRTSPDVRRRHYTRPAQAVVGSFAIVILLGAGLLMLPVAQAPGSSTSFVEALFTATSAVCVVGLVVVDTGTHWSLTGQLIILGLIQAGGLGIMTLATLLGIVVMRRFGIRLQLSLQTETRTFQVADVSGIARRILLMSLTIEAALAAVMVTRLWTHYDESFWRGLYIGVFHAISAFNNAGFSLFADSMSRYSADGWMLLPAMIGVILGGIGFPVMLELWRHARSPKLWSLHTKLTVYTTLVLLVGGITAITTLEWNNPDTLGPMGLGEKLLAGSFHGVMPRSGGLNAIDTGAMTEASLFTTIMLMFVGGGSGGTAGGIKVTTFAVLWIVLWSEMRGHPHVHASNRRLSSGVIRQSLSLTFLSMTMLAMTTVVLLALTPFPMEQVLFEATSAVGVVGLSTGITGDLPPFAQGFLVMIMFAGRIGPITFASALALRERTRRYDLPEGRPIIG
ncbi:TrkH family potassium uptake protein [Lipingzhangella rawalii]|nr:potassium transporter TrkG [Lipingzhangella rawalii]